jgi:hypothetical protein
MGNAPGRRVYISFVQDACADHPQLQPLEQRVHEANCCTTPEPSQDFVSIAISTNLFRRESISLILNSRVSRPGEIPNDAAISVGALEPNPRPSLGRSTGSLPSSNTPDCSKQSKTSSTFTSPSSFLGPTSFSAVFSDNRDNFGSASSNLATSTELLANQDFQMTNIDSDQIRMGIKVLTQIPNEVACEILFSRHTNPNDGSIRLAWKRLSSSLHLEHGAILEKRQPNEIKSWAQHISRTTNSELNEDEDDSVKWFKTFSGSNLRWEALGILFTYWSFGALASAEGDLVFAYASTCPKNRVQMMIEMKQCAVSCIALSSHVDHGNSLLVYLLYKHSLLETIVGGDASECGTFITLQTTQAN